MLQTDRYLRPLNVCWSTVVYIMELVSIMPLVTGRWSLVTFVRCRAQRHHREQGPIIFRALFAAAALPPQPCASRLGRTQPKGSTSQIIHLGLLGSATPCDARGSPDGVVALLPTCVKLTVGF